MASVFPDNRREQFLDKPLPSSEESERIILGAILLDNSGINYCIGTLTPEMFYSPLNRRVFAAMQGLFHQQKPIDPILIGEELKKEGSLQAIGGVTAITNLTFGLPYFSNIEAYIQTVVKHFIAREMIRLCGRTTSDLLAEDEEVASVISRHESSVYKLRDRHESEALVSIRPLARESIEKSIAMAKTGTVAVLGVPSGFADLDAMTSGYQVGDLIITAGRPSMGKTALCLGKTLKATDWNPELVIAIFSLEMKKKKLIDRFICMEAHMDMKRYRIGHVMNGEWPSISAAVDKFQTRHIYIDDAPRLSVMEIRARCRRLFLERKRLDLVIIDHGGLLKPARQQDRRLELGGITKDLKAMAKDLDVPVNLLFQLSRGPEKRPDHKPIMSDLRESGEIEEDADVVELLYRPEYYQPTIENEGLAKVIVGKNRDGPTGEVKLTWVKNHTRFENYYEGQ